LFAEDYITHLAATVEQALTLLSSATYDLIITDLSLPGMSGLELLEYVRRRWPEIPVIVISGMDYQQHAGDLINLGAFDYLIKPFRLEDLKESVSNALEHLRRSSKND
jgi:DNA-binding NtrC family response regulator